MSLLHANGKDETGKVYGRLTVKEFCIKATLYLQKGR